MTPNLASERRRTTLKACALPVFAVSGLGAVSGSARAQVGDAARLQAAHDAAIGQFTGGAALTPGPIRLEIASLVDNGNTVPVAVACELATSGPRAVQAIALFADRNPSPEVMEAVFSPASGRAQLATRMRLVTSQTVTAIAKLAEGTCIATSAQVIVTLAACLEPEES